MKSYQEFEAWASEQLEDALDGLDRIDLMWAAYQQAVRDIHDGIERLEEDL